MSNLLILLGYNDEKEAYLGAVKPLIQPLTTQLQIPIQTAYLESSPSVGESIQLGVAAHHPRYVVVLPLFVGTNEAKSKNVQMIVDAANERGFDAIAHYGKPLGTHPAVISAYSDLIRESATNEPETALLLIGRGSRDATVNAEAYQMARLLYENSHYASVDVAFNGTTKPNIEAGIKRCVQTGARRIVLVPYVLYDAQFTATVRKQVQQQQTLYPDVEIVVTPDLGADSGIIQAIIEHYHEALSELTSQLSSDGQYIPRPHSHGAGGKHTHPIPSSKTELQALLPPRYQGNVSVNAAPMGAADLIYDAQGRVAWDQIWGDFCDLALAGGPPHRGTLLEPVAPEIVNANPQRYQAVLAELERGIRMITKLPVITNASAGWIGVQCTDEAMALWLLRAIVVENISIRREGAVLYFPASPDFRLEYEIKNIITVIAKTHHYWTEHIASQPHNSAG